jgi:hypothetical protein
MLSFHIHSISSEDIDDESMLYFTASFYKALLTKSNCSVKQAFDEALQHNNPHFESENPKYKLLPENGKHHNNTLLKIFPHLSSKARCWDNISPVEKVYADEPIKKSQHLIEGDEAVCCCALLQTLHEQGKKGSAVVLTGERGIGKTHCSLAAFHYSFLRSEFSSYYVINKSENETEDSSARLFSEADRSKFEKVYEACFPECDQSNKQSSTVSTVALLLDGFNINNAQFQHFVNKFLLTKRAYIVVTAEFMPAKVEASSDGFSSKVCVVCVHLSLSLSGSSSF